MKNKIWGIILALLTSFVTATAAAPASKPNVLLIIADDLNNWIGPMKGHPQTVTPNLDRLAKRGVTFQNAQAAAPLCNPSRASFMTGRRPSTTGIYNNQQRAMPHIPRGVAINDYIRKFGYTSLGCGKIYHYHQYREADWDKVVYYDDDTFPWKKAVRSPGPFGFRVFTEGKPTEPFHEQRAESALIDYRSVSWAIEQLQQQSGPFFLVCGIHRPHTSWDVPKKYFDMHPIDTITLPKVLPNDLDDVPPAGIKFARNGFHDTIVKLGVWKDYVRGYLAAISYCDAQVGRLLDALDQSKFKDNTIVIFMGDNGYHFGQKEHWAKSALWREATRVPLIWSASGITKAGASCNRAVDLDSLFPTICELTGVPTPAWCEGVSIAPLLKKPSAKWDKPAISTFLQNNHAICTEQWRYIRYADGSEELYNEQSDPSEWKNEAKNPKLAKIKADLGKFIPTVNVTPIEETATGAGTNHPDKDKSPE